MHLRRHTRLLIYARHLRWRPESEWAHNRLKRYSGHAFSLIAIRFVIQTMLWMVVMQPFIRLKPLLEYRLLSGTGLPGSIKTERFWILNNLDPHRIFKPPIRIGILVVFISHRIIIGSCNLIVQETIYRVVRVGMVRNSLFNGLFSSQGLNTKIKVC